MRAIVAWDDILLDRQAGNMLFREKSKHGSRDAVSEVEVSKKCMSGIPVLCVSVLQTYK